MNPKGINGARLSRPMAKPREPGPRVTAAAIRFLRDRLELSRSQFAEALGLSLPSGKTTVFRWEHGLVVPSAEAQQRVADLASARGVKL